MKKAYVLFTVFGLAINFSDLSASSDTLNWLKELMKDKNVVVGDMVINRPKTYVGGKVITNNVNGSQTNFYYESESHSDQNPPEAPKKGEDTTTRTRHRTTTTYSNGNATVNAQSGHSDDDDSYESYDSDDSSDVFTKGINDFHKTMNKHFHEKSSKTPKKPRGTTSETNKGTTTFDKETGITTTTYPNGYEEIIYPNGDMVRNKVRGTKTTVTYNNYGR